MSVLCWYLSLWYSVNVAVDVVVEDLADGHAGVDPHRLHGEHFQRPVAAEAHVAESGRHVDEQPQPPDRRAALDHRHEVVRLGPLDGAAEIELVGLEHEPFGGMPMRRTRLAFRMSSTTSS